MTLITNPFLQGTKFGEDQKAFDSIYLLSVNETKRCVENGSFVVKTTDNTAMFFMNRQVDRITNMQSFTPFQYQFSPTGGFLERDNYNEDDSLFSGTMLEDFYSKLKNFKEKFSKELKEMSGGEMKAGDFSLLIVKKGILKKIFSNKNMNPDLVEYVGGDKIPELVDKYMISQKEFASDQERIEFEAFRRLMGYLSAMYPRCPVCNNAVSMSWGWCPYHGTKEMLILKDRTDEGDKGTLRDEFIREYGKRKIEDLMNNSMGEEEQRILVHCTEFMLS